VLWLLAEIAIIATDIAEVIGTAIGLNLLFGIPLEIGVIITALDVFLILYLQKLGFRWVEA
jgi:manganese transport protein